MGLCPSRNVERERDDEEPQVVRPGEVRPQNRPTVVVSPSNPSVIIPNATSTPREFDDIPPLVQNILEELQSTESHTQAENDVTSTNNDQTATNDVDNESTASELEVPTNAQVLLVVLPPRPSEPDRPRLLLLVISGNGANPLPAMNDETQFQNILNQLFQAAQPKSHPTSAKAIKCLPSTVMNDQLLAKTPKCVICCEEFQLGQNVIKMPCDHIFERECVEPWLKTNNTCPVCRYELPVEDKEYEKERREKMKQSRGEINEVDFFGEEDGKSEI